MIIDNWKEVLQKAYSVWFAIAGLILLHASDIIYKLFEIDTNPKAWTWILTWFFIAVIISRFVPQPETGKWKRRGCVILFMMVLFGCNGPALAHECTAQVDREEITFDLISRWEGKRNQAYQDIVGVWTICYGHTKTAGPDKYYNDAKCYDLLNEEIDEYRTGLHKSFTQTTMNTRLTPYRDAAYTSLAYNVGIRAAGRSTATRRLNRGDIEGGCEALTWWNKGTFNGTRRVVRGLVRRRSEEQEYCLRGLI